MLSLNFFFNENFLLSGSFDGTIKMWMMTKCKCYNPFNLVCPCSECVANRPSAPNLDDPKEPAILNEPWERGRAMKGKFKVVEVKEGRIERLVKCDLCKGRGVVGKDRVLEVGQDPGPDLRNLLSRRKKMEHISEVNSKWCDVSHNSLEVLNSLVQDLNENRRIKKPELFRKLANVLKSKWMVERLDFFDPSKLKKNNQVHFVEVGKNNESQLFSFKKGPRRAKKSKAEAATKAETSKSSGGEIGISLNNMQKILEIKKVVEPLYEQESKQVPENLTDFLDFLKNVFTEIAIKVNHRLSMNEERAGQSKSKKASGAEQTTKNHEKSKKMNKLNETENALIEQTSGFKSGKKTKQMKRLMTNLEQGMIAENGVSKVNNEMAEKFESFRRYIHFLENQILQHKTEKIYLETQLDDLNKKSNLLTIENQNLASENHLLLLQLENKTFKSNLLEGFVHEICEDFPEVRERYFKHKSSITRMMSQKELSVNLLRQKMGDRGGQHSFHAKLASDQRKSEANHEEKISREKENEKKRSFTSFCAQAKDQKNTSMQLSNKDPQILNLVAQEGSKKMQKGSENQANTGDISEEVSDEQLIPKRSQIIMERREKSVEFKCEKRTGKPQAVELMEIKNN